MLKYYATLLVTALLATGSYADVNVVTTIKPLQLIAQAVTKEHGSVSSIVDPQQSPHHFSLSPSDRIALARADLAVWIGPLFETHLQDFFLQSALKAKTLTAIDIDGLQLHYISEGQLDAHLWLDSSNALKIAAQITEQVSALDPSNAISYRQNLDNFETEIAQGNQQIARKFETATTVRYAVYHNAYQYFEQQFSLQHDLVILRDPETQPGIREIVQLRERINQRQPSCLLLEIDSSEELIATVISGHELKSIVVDLLGTNVSNDLSTEAISIESGYSKFIANIADDFYECLYE